ncbi:MAG: TonB-dependent receptor, partial [Bacteroidetes bacterium]|nr:TonB-dependent receptor [Bacteroidota bacterium]
MTHQLHLLRPLPLLIGLALAGTAALGQRSLKGRVTDNGNNPIGYVNVSLRGDGATALNSVSDSLGRYSFSDLKPRTYMLVFSYLKVIRTITLNLTEDTTVDVALGISDGSLAGVTVSGRKPLIERKVDRLVFNVDNSVAAVGGDGLDVLKITPGVKVTDDQLQIIGKSTLKVMVNGKFVQLSGDNLIAYLRSLPASSIQSIEVITTPPAKYEAEGNSGLVNIVLKTARRDSWNASVRGSLTQNSLLGYGAGGRIDYQKGRLSLFGDAGDAEYQKTNHYHNEIFYPVQTWSSDRATPSSYRSAYARIGLDYALTRQWSVGAQYEGDFSRSTLNSSSTTTIFSGRNLVDSFIQSQGATHGRNTGNSYNIHSIYKIDSTGRRLSIDLDLFDNQGSTGGYMSGLNLYPTKKPIGNSDFSNSNNNVSSIRNYSAGVDLEWPMKWVSLDLGGKISSNLVDNDYRFTSTGGVWDADQNNLYRYKEEKEAVYLSGSRKIGSSIETQLGLRAENTRTSGYSRDSDSTHVNQYLKFFPSAYLTWHPGNNKSLSATYNKRLDRPGFGMLDPYRTYLNSQSSAQGNPLLQPSFTDNAELIFNYGNNETKVYYSYTTGGFDQIAYIDAANNTTSYTYENYLRSRTWGIEQSYTFRPASWWTSSNSVNLSWNLNRSTNPSTPQKADLLTGYFSTSNDLILNHQKSL